MAHLDKNSTIITYHLRPIVHKTTSVKQSRKNLIDYTKKQDTLHTSNKTTSVLLTSENCYWHIAHLHFHNGQ